MLKFILKRLIQSIPVIIIAVTFSFFITHFMPGDPVRTLLGDKASEQQVLSMRNELFLNQPLLTQFSIWASGVLTMDLGQSIFWKEPILDLIVKRIEPTFILAFIGIIFSVIIGVPTGLKAAEKRGKVFDKSFSVATLLSISIPGFWLAIMAIQIFCVRIHIFPVAGYDSIGKDGLLNALYHLALPGMILGVMYSGQIARMTRTTMLEVMSHDYLRTARGKGVKERKVLYVHAFVNAMPSIIMVVGFSFGSLLGGAAVIEQLFNIPGLGNLLINAVLKRDYPLIQGSLLFISMIFILINTLVDIICILINPKERLE
ncbi:ABC transporter permease [Helicovermis profundi]|uniref:ABC transporter permease n=1 Tax=Helicovermis profundi TaxID=3065157 RepID=A0AAU9E1B9_9FIRM|nr:ABC transporter permease [Clostridia bacterium S502]